MKSRRPLYLLIPAVAILTACSSTSQHVMKPDVDYMQKVETSSRYSFHPVSIHWVNPPLKRELRQDNKQD